MACSWAALTCLLSAMAFPSTARNSMNLPSMGKCLHLLVPACSRLKASACPILGLHRGQVLEATSTLWVMLLSKVRKACLWFSFTCLAPSSPGISFSWQHGQLPQVGLYTFCFLVHLPPFWHAQISPTAAADLHQANLQWPPPQPSSLGVLGSKGLGG